MRKIARVGANCQAVARADRVAFLVDARAYFERLATAMERARRSILIVGWDIHSGTRLRRDDDDSPGLAAFLQNLIERRPELEVHILVWDCNVLCSISREKLQTLRLGWQTSSRLHYFRDGLHRNGACHHEKIVVIDDNTAFVGGIDLTARRWDTPGHVENHYRRVDPSGNPYGPYHDVQLALSGPVARVLGQGVRERWVRATGTSPEIPETSTDPWPPDLEPTIQDVEVGLSRTDTSDVNRPPVAEIEALYLNALEQARDTVFIENQYLSSDVIGRGLAGLLERENGPQICIVTPNRVSGWLEQVVMGRLRARVVERLRAADRHRRLGLWCPDRTTDDDPIIVHSKVLVVDDEFVTIGSANISNRSMSLDTETNVFVEAAGDSRIRGEIAGLRDRLLAEHLGRRPEQVAATLEQTGSINRAISALRGRQRTLEPLEIDPDQATDTLAGAERLLDPERPLEWTDLVQQFFGAG